MENNKVLNGKRQNSQQIYSNNNLYSVTYQTFVKHNVFTTHEYIIKDKIIVRRDLFMVELVWLSVMTD